MKIGWGTDATAVPPAAGAVPIAGVEVLPAATGGAGVAAGAGTTGVAVGVAGVAAAAVGPPLAPPFIHAGMLLAPRPIPGGTAPGGGKGGRGVWASQGG